MTVGDAYEPPTYGSIGNPVGWTLEQALETTGPFLVEQSNPNPRLRAQEGFFVAGALPKQDLARDLSGPFASLDIEVPPGDSERLQSRLTAERSRGNPMHLPLVAVIINAGLKKRLLAYLENSYNRSARVLFPDYPGFVNFGLPNFEGT
ncbi:hypothetical protein H5392_09590 [Tessaracoccus sp. MC1865]|uniref:hypothetical protein n=1 Tax=Tessaracoccus sp. MC1865 TaxID=2760310 RepID=UPI0016020A96|nr:hypothetical protein [Tessaracoccus sp. MC1865]MBB1484109.1 hypothetical protein [Tessaracoccus sp. MC1865]QTO37138.1 hypothetical protein J7D54_11955 [Tessaracoccus sp. MC1865]